MPQTIFERALEFVADGMVVGLGSGRAATKFTELLGERIRGGMRVRGVATSQATAEVARRAGIKLVTLEEAATIDVTIDGADEVDPRLNVIKGYGRALVREKIVAAASHILVILIGDEKLVPILGMCGKLPVEVVPFAVPLCLRKMQEFGCPGTLVMAGDRPFVSDNGNDVIDAKVGPLADAAALHRRLRDVPGVVDTGLFLDMADIVLVGDDKTFELRSEKRRP